MLGLSELLSFCVNNNASDLHIATGESPMLRIDGELHRFSLPVFEPASVKSLLYETMNDKQRELFEAHLQVDFAFEIEHLARFRVNIFQQARGLSAVFRIIPLTIKSMDELHHPRILRDIAMFPRGLVLVTGQTGSGKTTTLAAMLDHINQTKHEHILTIEDPIEFVHHNQQCLVSQREVYRDTLSFHAALHAALREDPDVIFIGELRDLETIRLALTAAETGHLVLASLHTSSAAKTINRIIDVFPAAEKAMVRTMLSESLQAVIAQSLLKARDTDGRHAAYEIMLCTSAIRNLIREDKVAQIYSSIQTGQVHGMQTMDQCLQALVAQQKISIETARIHAVNKDLFAG